MRTSKVVIVDTADYIRSHGKAPRGFGGWAFCTVDPRRPDYLDHIIWLNGTYRAARKEAIARARGVVAVLWVCA